MYISGYTLSNPFDGNTTKGSIDAYISKFDSSGVRQWTKTLGGSTLDLYYAIVLDSNSNIYATGYTDSNPIDGQIPIGGTDVLLSMYNSSGVKQYTQIFGGSGSEYVYGLAIDSESSLFVAGYTNSNPFDGQATSAGNNAFITKIIKCDISCGSCLVTSNNCTSCSPNYYKILTSSFPTQCYNQIPSYGYILNSNSY